MLLIPVRHGETEWNREGREMGHLDSPLTDRGVQQAAALAHRHVGERVVAVTHGGFLMGFLEHVLSLAPGNGARFRKPNASYNAFGYHDGRWHLETWNDTTHLQGIPSLDDPGLEQVRPQGPPSVQRP